MKPLHEKTISELNFEDEIHDNEWIKDKLKGWAVAIVKENRRKTEYPYDGLGILEDFLIEKFEIKENDL